MGWTKEDTDRLRYCHDIGTPHEFFMRDAARMELLEKALEEIASGEAWNPRDTAKFALGIPTK